MSRIVIKTVKGRAYRYLQRSYRDGAHVRTESIYLGPVDGVRRRNLLTRIGDLIEANRSEPGTRLTNQMIEASQALAAKRDAAEKAAEDAFYEHMHTMYGMTRPVAHPVPIEKVSAAVTLPAAQVATAATPPSSDDEAASVTDGNAAPAPDAAAPWESAGADAAESSSSSGTGYDS